MIQQDVDLTESLNNRWTANKEAIFQEITRLITSNLDISQIYDEFASQVKKLVGFDRIALNVVYQNTNQRVIKCVAGWDKLERSAGSIFPLQGSQTEYVLSRGHSLIRRRIGETLPRFLGDKYSIDARLRSSIAVPLISHDLGVGSLVLFSSKVGA